MTVGHAVGVGLLRVRWVELTFVAIADRLGQHEPAWATGGMVPPMAAQAARSTHSLRRAPNQRAARAAASPLACASRSLLIELVSGVFTVLKGYSVTFSNSGRFTTSLGNHWLRGRGIV